jgi:hypothetical protein
MRKVIERIRKNVNASTRLSRAERKRRDYGSVMENSLESPFIPSSPTDKHTDLSMPCSGLFWRYRRFINGIERKELRGLLSCLDTAQLTAFRREANNFTDYCQ